MHMVKSEDARKDAAEKLRALRRRFMAHRDYFSKQGELKNGLAMLSEVMDRAADRLHGHSQRHRRPLTSSGAR